MFLVYDYLHPCSFFFVCFVFVFVLNRETVSHSLAQLPGGIQLQLLSQMFLESVEHMSLARGPCGL